ncbi:MAG: alpha/beta hydrolase [Erysipelotrichaceae bacterium]|nr:alpha/beta hydrolase [Erysipelotrichaceae bacterium]
MIFLFVVFELIIVILGIGYLIFISTLGRNFSLPGNPDADPDDGNMKPTGKRLIAFQKPYIDAFKELPFEECCIKSFDNLKLYAYLIKGNPEEVVIFMHGYRSNKENDFADKYEIYKERNSTMLFLDGRAHGKSEGKYIGFSELDRFDIEKWVDFINEKYDNPRIYLHGVSMGGASVIHCANMHLNNLCGIIDDCGFTSGRDITAVQMKGTFNLPYFPFATLATFFAKNVGGVDFDKSKGEECARESDVPIVYIHGKADVFVPCWMSEKMYEATVKPKRLLLVEGAGHAAAYMMAPAEYKNLVNELLDGKVV